MGVIVYFRKEGRSLGEVTKFLVYNARKRQVSLHFCFHLIRQTLHKTELDSLSCAAWLARLDGWLFQEGGDRAETYFHRTACVAGVEDMRFQASFSHNDYASHDVVLTRRTPQELMPDSLHWLGITKIDDLVSMSDMKYNAIVGSGIQVPNSTYYYFWNFNLTLQLLRRF